MPVSVHAKLMKTRFLVSLAVLLLEGVGLAGQSGSSTQSAPPESQQPAVTFRAEVNYVEVDARVMDAQGRFVANLQPDEFELFEDGKPQKVTAFSLVNIPVERESRPLFAKKVIERDVATNIAGYDGRVYLIGNALVNEFLTARDWPGGAAKAVVLIGVMLIAISLYLWFVNRGRRTRDVSLV